MTSFEKGIIYFDSSIDMEYLTRDEGEKFRETFMLKLGDNTIDSYAYEIENEDGDDKTLNIEITYPGLERWKCMVSNSC